MHRAVRDRGETRMKTPQSRLLVNGVEDSQYSSHAGRCLSSNDGDGPGLVARHPLSGCTFYGSALGSVGSAVKASVQSPRMLTLQWLPPYWSHVTSSTPALACRFSAKNAIAEVVRR